jgi:pyrroloquinoline quinone (PQQ) biosynthesis protein C
MDRKHHWAYPVLTRPGLTRPQLLQHFRHEFLVYVRDFPVLVAAALGNAPPLGDVREALAENLYEEQTGGLSKTAPHPELFLRMMEGLGFARSELDEDESALHPAAIAYRRELRGPCRGKRRWRCSRSSSKGA